MQDKQPRKEQFKKQQKQQVIWLAIKLLIKQQVFQRKKSAKELPNDETKEEEDVDVEITTLKKRYISPEERQQVIVELRLVSKKYV